MNINDERIAFYEKLHNQIAGPAFVLKHSPLTGSLLHQHRWACFDANEPMEFLTAVEFSKHDELDVIGKSEYELIRYLRDRFGSLFKTK